MNCEKMILFQKKWHHIHNYKSDHNFQVTPQIGCNRENLQSSEQKRWGLNKSDFFR